MSLLRNIVFPYALNMMAFENLPDSQLIYAYLLQNTIFVARSTKAVIIRSSMILKCVIHWGYTDNIEKTGIPGCRFLFGHVR